jgi:hypothetical protein
MKEKVNKDIDNITNNLAMLQKHINELEIKTNLNTHEQTKLEFYRKMNRDIIEYRLSNEYNYYDNYFK